MRLCGLLRVAFRRISISGKIHEACFIPIQTTQQGYLRYCLILKLGKAYDYVPGDPSIP